MHYTEQEEQADQCRMETDKHVHVFPTQQEFCWHHVCATLLEMVFKGDESSAKVLIEGKIS